MEAIATPNDRAVIGSNLPPLEPADLLRIFAETPVETLLDALHMRLVESNADLTNRAADIKAAMDDANRVPAVVDSDELAKKMTTFIGQIKAPIGIAEERRVATKAPFFKADKAVHAFFVALQEQLGGYAKTCTDRLESYLREKARKAREEARRHAAQQQAAREILPMAASKPADLSRVRGTGGGVASLTTSWTFEIEDTKKIPLALLRPYLGRDAIEKAIRAFVRAGGRELKGVRIFEDHKARVG